MNLFFWEKIFGSPAEQRYPRGVSRPPYPRGCSTLAGAAGQKPAGQGEGLSARGSAANYPTSLYRGVRCQVNQGFSGCCVYGVATDSLSTILLLDYTLIDLMHCIRSILETRAKLFRQLRSSHPGRGVSNTRSELSIKKIDDVHQKFS